jgi:hypothetical protein
LFASYSLTHSLINPLTRPLITHSLIHPLIHWPTLITYSRTHSPTHHIQILSHSPTCPLTHLRTYSPTHLPRTYVPTDSLTQTLTLSHCFRECLWITYKVNNNQYILHSLCPDQLWCPLSLLSTGYWGRFPRGKERRGVTLTTHPPLMPRSMMTRSYISSPLGASMAWRDNFTLLVSFTRNKKMRYEDSQGRVTVC